MSYKPIKVKSETREKLKQIKKDYNCTSIDEVILGLIEEKNMDEVLPIETAMTKKIICPACGSDKYKPIRHDLVRKAKGKDGYFQIFGLFQFFCSSCYGWKCFNRPYGFVPNPFHSG